MWQSMSRWKWPISYIFQITSFIWSDYVDFAPDIDFAFFIVTQGICFDTNMLCFGMFGDFMDKIACIVLW